MAKKSGSRKSGVWAVIVAAGASRRMGFNKLTAELEGQPVLGRSVAAFNQSPHIDAIVLVCAASARAVLEKIARAAAPSKL